MKKLIITMAALAGLAFAQANAAIYQYERGPLGTNNAGQITGFTTQYDDVNEDLWFTIDIDYNNVGAADAPTMGWIAFNGGGVPNGNNRTAQMVIDFATGDLLVYQYGGTGMPTQNRHIATYNGVVDITNQNGIYTIQLEEFDVSGILNGDPFNNPATWSGTGFNEQIGIWAHFFDMDAFATNGTHVTSWGDGSLGGNPERSGFDIHYGSTTVSEPAGLAFIGLIGMLALMRRRVK